MRYVNADRMAVFALLVLNAVVRALFIGFNELAHDEPFTVFQAHRSLSDLWEMLRTENNPPVYFLIMKAWLLVAGDNVAWLRLPSALASALTVWPLYLIGARLGGRRVGWAAALLFTCSGFEQGFAHEVRAYSLFVLWATAAMWQLVRHAAPPNVPPHDERPGWIALALFNALMVYTHFFGWWMILVQVLCVAFVRPLRSARKGTAIAVGIALLSYLPYLPIFLDRMTESVDQGTWLTAPQPEELYNMIWRFSNVPVLAVGFLVLAVAVLIRREGRERTAWVGLLWGILPLILMFLVSFKVPMFLDRYVSFAAPGFYLLVGHALVKTLPGTVASSILALVGVTAMAVTFEPDKPSGLDPSSVVAVANAMGKGKAPVVIAPPWYAYTYAWHVDPALFHDPEHFHDSLAARNIHTVRDPGEVPVDITTTEVVILVDAWSALSDPEGKQEALLRAAYPDQDRIEADDKVWVTRYRR